MGQKRIVQRYPIQDFSGGTVTDRTLKLRGNELLQATNVTINPGGDFEKRKGTELLSSAGTSLNPSGDIYGVYWYAYDSVHDCWYLGYAFEKTKGTKTVIVGIQYEDDDYDSAETAYNAWVTAATDGSYNTNYNYAWGDTCNGV